MDVIKKALGLGHKALSEYHSKKILSSYHIPVTREALALSRDEAVYAAEKIGYPVVLKACSHELMHKSDNNCIELNVRDKDQVLKAYQKITDAVKIDLEGVLVQEMVFGQRELVIGLNRDPQFGPCVMFGIGGIMTEIISDTAFRVAPFDHSEALDMVQELRLKKVFEEFRGQKPADLDAISKCIISAGKIGLENSKISEIDINPLIVDHEGNIKAVDALIIL